VTNYYVYYRVDPSRVAGLRAEVEDLLRRILQQTGVHGRWLRRRDYPLTYMEVYEAVADEVAFESILARESEMLGLQRSTERFVCA